MRLNIVSILILLSNIKELFEKAIEQRDDNKNEIIKLMAENERLKAEIERLKALKQDKEGENMKYRKKPVVIEAIQWTGNNHREMWDFLTGKTNECITVEGDNFYIDHNKVPGGLIIKTLEGEHIASIGDFIIKGISGEFYPCKPDIFNATYEPIDEPVLKNKGE